MDKEQNGTKPWRMGTHDSILDSMRIEQAPQGSSPTSTRDAALDTAPDDAVIRAFLIADVRGYTMFTQERGDGKRVSKPITKLRLVPIDCDDVAIDRFYFDRFLDSANTNEQDRVAPISFLLNAAQ